NDVMIIAIDAKILALAALNPIEAAIARQLEQLGHRSPIGFEPCGELGGAELVDQLERSELPIIAELHRIIDGDNAVGSRRNEAGRVCERAAEHRPGIIAHLALEADQR